MRGPVAQPGDSNVGRQGLVFLRNRQHFIQQRGVFFAMHQAPQLTQSTSIAMAILPGQQTTAQRRPQGGGHPQRFGHRQQFTFCGPLYQAVFHLYTCNARPATQFCQHICTGNAPGWEVGQPGILDLAGADQIVKAANDLFKRRQVVGKMRPQQIDTIGFQPLQAVLYRGNHVFAAVAGIGNTRVRRCTQGVFSGDHETVAFGGDKIPYHLF
ncbi:hypothetical protein D3C71_1428430 [compost metagenome]